ncbi:MAG: CDP-alcohol phosphatidyltransferase family protein [Polyangiales bacterium]
MTNLFRARDLLSLPGVLSLSRVGLAVVFPFVVHRPWLALTIIAVAGVSDVLDGYVARWLNQTSPTGAALDPITDKIFATTVMASLLVTHRLPIGWALLLSARELAELPLVVWLLCVPHARRVRAHHMQANILGKVTTVLQFGALCSLLFSAPQFTWWITATAGTGLLAAASYWLSFRNALRAAPPPSAATVAPSDVWPQDLAP